MPRKSETESRLGSFANTVVPVRFRNRPLPVVPMIVIAGIALTAAILLVRRDVAGGAEPGLLDYPRGPHGARLVSDSSLQLEVTTYETGVPPRFRVYPYDANLKPLSPADVDLRIELHRLGGRVDSIGFRPEADYLLGDGVVEEPHSFDV